MRFLRQNLRRETPEAEGEKPFDLILCRNLAFTYFDEVGSDGPWSALGSGGGLVMGLKERLPPDSPGVRPWIPELRVYRKG